MRITGSPGRGPGDCVPQKPATAAHPHSRSRQSWDPALAYAFGEVAGTETANLATHVFEAPGLNIARVPQNGRNFEYFGEDPYLAGRMAVEQVKAVQSKGVIAMPKHYVANNQETNRFEVDELIDERTLREISSRRSRWRQGWRRRCGHVRLPPHQRDLRLRERVSPEGGAPEGVGLQGIRAVGLRRRTQHGAVHPGGRGPGEMNTGTWYSATRINAALAAGAIQVADIDVLLKRRFYSMFRLGQFDRPLVETPIDAVGHGRLGRSIAEQSAVLLTRTARAAARRVRLPLDRTDRAASAGARGEHTGGEGSPRSSPYPSPLSRACGTS